MDYGENRIMDLITLFLTCANKAEAKAITEKLIDERLAACVRISDVNSTFWWEGKKEYADEVMLIIESVASKFGEIETTVRKLHSYETFVLTAYSVVKASGGVSEWVKEATS
jgi:periplasmic divalent cation tolerance protein